LATAFNEDYGCAQQGAPSTAVYRYSRNDPHSLSSTFKLQTASRADLDSIRGLVWSTHAPKTIIELIADVGMEQADRESCEGAT